VVYPIIPFPRDVVMQTAAGFGALNLQIQLIFWVSFGRKKSVKGFIIISLSLSHF
jgi:hypothetical protein